MENIKGLSALPTEMKLTIRQFIKLLNESTFKKLLEISGLTEEEYWVAYYSYKKRMVQNTCMKLNMSQSKYHNVLNVALAKIETTIKKVNKINIFI